MRRAARTRAQRFFEDARDLRREGTLPPFSRASLSPIAIACFLLRTVRPELLFSDPFLRRRIADATRFEADFPYFAMLTPPPARPCKACARSG